MRPRGRPIVWAGLVLVAGCGGGPPASPAPNVAPRVTAAGPPAPSARAPAPLPPGIPVCSPVPWSPEDAPRYIMPAGPPGPGSRVEQLPILLNSREVNLRLGQQFMQVARGYGLNPPSGTARFWVFIEATGALSQIELEASSGTEALDLAGRRVIEEMMYRPAIVGDCAVSAWARVPVEFRMIRR